MYFANISAQVHAMIDEYEEISFGDYDVLLDNNGTEDIEGRGHIVFNEYSYLESHNFPFYAIYEILEDIFSDDSDNYGIYLVDSNISHNRLYIEFCYFNRLA